MNFQKAPPEDQLIEECGEVIQAVMKGKRFGWNNFHPDRVYTTNYEELKKEINDLNEAFDKLTLKIGVNIELTPGKLHGICKSHRSFIQISRLVHC